MLWSQTTPRQFTKEDGAVLNLKDLSPDFEDAFYTRAQRSLQLKVVIAAALLNHDCSGISI